MKRILAYIMVFAMIMTCMTAAFAASILYGDVDGDNEVAITDATAVQLHVARIKAIAETKFEFSDVDDDNEISIMDSTEIQRHVARIIEVFPAEENAVDYSNLVSDLSYDAVEYEDWRGTKEAIFAVPKINLSGSEIAQINEEIADNYSSLAGIAKKELVSPGYFTTSKGVEYEWFYYDDILSLYVVNHAHPNATPRDEYTMYNISVSDRRLITQDDLLKVKGITREEYVKQAQVAFGHLYLNIYDGVYESMGSSSAYKKQFDRTVAKSNVESAMLYINNDGDLCAVAKVYAIAGADSYYNTINLENYELNRHYNEYA